MVARRLLLFLCHALRMLAALPVLVPLPADAKLDRVHDPVIVPWDRLASLETRDTARLLLYRAVSGKLEPIPFQLDSRDEDGELVVDGPVDFTLDGNDELVFMAKDAGEQAPSLLDAVPGCDRALEIELVDSVAGGRAWAYLLAFRDPPDRPAFTPYVTFDVGRREARSDRYRVEYADQRNFFTGLEIANAANGTDGNLVRKTHMRGSPTFGLLFTDVTLDFTEENSIVEIDGIRTGPVRAVRRVRLSVDLGPLFPELPSGTAYTYHYRSTYLTPTRVKFPWIMLQTLRSFRFESLFDFRTEALPLRYHDAWNPDGILLSDASPVDLHIQQDHDWFAHSSDAGSVLHAFVIPEQWREWGVVRGTVVRAGTRPISEDDEDEGDDPGVTPALAAVPTYAAGYTLLNMTRLQKAGSYDLLMASVISPEPFSPGDEASSMAMLRAPLGVEVRRVR
jgi:hypothetical protein